MIIRRLVLVLVIVICHITASASDNTARQAREFALRFFESSSGMIPGMQKARTEDARLEVKYMSREKAKTEVVVVQHGDKGFVMLALENGLSRVVGYAPDGAFDQETMPPQLANLIRHYEQGTLIGSASVNSIYDIVPVVHPLLDSAGISLNQFDHPQVGNCPTGCVATAVAQLLLYNKHPRSGVGSHCYTHSVHGEVCTDFTKGDYMNNPEQLSFDLGVAMEMNYCGDSFYTYGSSPGIKDYLAPVVQRFKSYVNRFPFKGSASHSKDTTYQYRVLRKRIPLYVELHAAETNEGGHAMVVDGYASNGFYHINFGWGGVHDGYYPLNSNSSIDVGYKYGTNWYNVCYITPMPILLNEKDSLALDAITRKLKAVDERIELDYSSFMGRVEVLTIDGITEDQEFNIQLPEELGDLTELQELELYGKVGSLPKSMANLSKLWNVSIEFRDSAQFEEGFITLSSLPSLKELYVKGVYGHLPDQVGAMPAIERLSLRNNYLSGELPSSIGNLKTLKLLHLENNQLSGSLPSSIGNLEQLEILIIANNKLSGSLPNSIGNLQQLEYLDLSNNQLSGSLPEELFNCKKIKNLNLGSNQFTGVVPDITPCDSLEWLFLNSNQLTGFATGSGTLTKLEIVGLSNNQLSEFPPVLGQCPGLKTIYLDYNPITNLPTLIGNLGMLETLQMRYNQLKLLPDELCLLPNLKILDFRSNHIERLPTMAASLRVEELHLDSNFIWGAVPVSFLNNTIRSVNLYYNQLIYRDMPRDTTIKMNVNGQRPVEFTNKVLKVNPYKPVVVDIRDICEWLSPYDVYEWYEFDPYEKNLRVFEKGPVIQLQSDEKLKRMKYYCKITNDSVQTFKMKVYLGGSWVEYDIPCFPDLVTDTLSIDFLTDEEVLRAENPGYHIVEANDIPDRELEDQEVTLQALPPLRGAQYWQASTDGVNWVDVSLSMSAADLKANVISVEPEQLKLTPKYPAYYRNVIDEAGCSPLYSDTLKVMPFGKLVCDTVMQPPIERVVVRADSAEVIIPKGFHDESFRLTIMKSDKIPEMPGTVKRMGTVYEFLTSVGDTFPQPLTIRLKNTSGITAANRTSFFPVFFNDHTGRWEPFDNVTVSVDSQFVEFITNHFTKITWFESGYGEYFNVLTNEESTTIVRVFYKSPHQPAYYVYEENIRDQDPAHYNQINAMTHLGNHPFMIKAVSVFAQEVLRKFLDDQLLVRADGKKLTFDVYVDQITSSFFGLFSGGDWNGQINFSGYTFGYIFLNNLYASSKEALMQTISHEMAHYAMDENMVTSIDNVFWNEAMAPVAGNYIWSDKVMKTSETEILLNKNLQKFGKDMTIFELLSQSWDVLDDPTVWEKLFVSTKDANLAGAFLHYLCHLRPEKLMKYDLLIKNHTTGTATTNWTWRAYLNTQIREQLGDESTIGKEYDAYVRYLLNSYDEEFTLLNNQKGNILSRLLASVNPENVADPDAFARYLNYNIKDNKPVKNKLELTMSYLSSKVQLLYNTSADKVMLVRYKRELEDAHPDEKVYYCKWDPEKGFMTFADISDKENYSILLKARDEEALKNFSNMGFLLFVNTRNPMYGVPYMLSNFNLEAELTAYPLPDWKEMAEFYIDGGKHHYSDGEYSSIVIPGRLSKMLKGSDKVSIKLVSLSTELTIEEDTILVMKTNFEEIFTLKSGFPLPDVFTKFETLQELRYNFLPGELEFVQRTRQTGSWDKWYDYQSKKEYPAHVTDRQWSVATLKMVNVFTFEPVKMPEPIGEIMVFETKTTEETLKAFVSYTFESQLVDYDMDGNVDREQTNTYIGSEFTDNLKLNLWFRNK